MNAEARLGTHCDCSPTARCSIDCDISRAPSGVFGEGQAESFEGLGQYCRADDGRGSVLSKGHSAVGEVRGEVEEHGSGAKEDGMGVARVGHNTVECVPQLCAAVTSIVATVRHSAGLGGGWGGTGTMGESSSGGRESGRQ